MFPVRIRFKASLPKDMAAPELNEDAYAPDRKGVVSKIAISDGASESYNSQLWANLLVKQFVLDAAINPAVIDYLIGEYNGQHNYAVMSWSQQSAYERGSFASLVGVEYSAEHNELDLIAVGDSLAVLLDNDAAVLTYPYHESSQFDQRPTLISTIKQHNRFIDESDFITSHSKTIALTQYNNPVLLLMTDALGQWALRNQEQGTPVWELLCNIKKPQLKKLVIEERQQKRMRTDDVTLLVVEC
jgi:serine/threonine protein phosphatase PrpC